jgi:hypothetical protein
MMPHKFLKKLGEISCSKSLSIQKIINNLDIPKLVFSLKALVLVKSKEINNDKSKALFISQLKHFEVSGETA